MFLPNNTAFYQEKQPRKKEILSYDDYGFAALPGGDGTYSGGFENIGYVGLWWTATESNATGAIQRNIVDDNAPNGIGSKSNLSKRYLFSVRCLKD